jgi:hypothetical protein
LRLNGLPGALRLRQEDIYEHAAFVADQLGNTEGIEGCKAVVGLQQEIKRRSQEASRQEDGGEEATVEHDDEHAAQPASVADADPNKRQRKAPATLLSEIESPADACRRSKPKPMSKDDGKRIRKGDRDASGPKAAQSAFIYFSKVARVDVQQEAGGALSFTEIGRLVAERWKVATDEQKAEYEAMANADRERYALEMQWHQEEMDAAERARESRKKSGRGLLACERESPAKKRKGDDEQGETKRRDEAKSDGRLAGLQFPMEDTMLLQREKAHRQMLLASGRSKLAMEQAKEPVSDSAPPLEIRPSYIYPPRGPHPALMPPMPETPTAEPLEPRPGCSSESTQKILQLWDFLNILGVAFKLQPLGLPLAALQSMLCCSCPLDYSLASNLHASMMLVIARDVEGLDGWGPWAKALKEPLLPLLWPDLLAQLLRTDTLFETVYGEGRDELCDALEVSEWAHLTPDARTRLLVWLADGVAQCETVRTHLDRNAEMAAELRREVRAMQEEEQAQGVVVAEVKQRAKALQEKVFKQQQLQQQQLDRKKVGVGATAAATAATAAAVRSLEEEEGRAAAEAATLAKMRQKRLDKQVERPVFVAPALPDPVRIAFALI